MIAMVVRTMKFYDNSRPVDRASLLQPGVQRPLALPLDRQRTIPKLSVVFAPSSQKVHDKKQQSGGTNLRLKLEHFLD